jgi:hypothetical protein
MYIPSISPPCLFSISPYLFISSVSPLLSHYLYLSTYISLPISFFLYLSSSVSLLCLYLFFALYLASSNSHPMSFFYVSPRFLSNSLSPAMFSLLSLSPVSCLSLSLHLSSYVSSILQPSGVNFSIICTFSVQNTINKISAAFSRSTAGSVPDLCDFFNGNGSSDPFPDFTDPEPIHLPAIFYNNLLKHHVTDNKFSLKKLMLLVTNGKK